MHMAAVGLSASLLEAATRSRAAEPIVVLSHQGVRSWTTSYLGMDALTLELTEGEQARRTDDARGGRPAYAVVPGAFQDGVIEVDLAADLSDRASAAAAAAVGLVFRLDDDARFEAIQLRMEDGALNHPPPPAQRRLKAVRYVSHPGLPLEGARDDAPGVHERSASIGPARWHRLRLDIVGRRLVAGVDGQHVLSVDDLRLDRAGRVALWVGDGTRGQFANLSIVPAGARR